jgi:hypothetical protein
MNGVWAAVLSTVSLVVDIGVETVSEHAGAVPVHSGSPPPAAVTVFELGLITAVPSMLTGTETTMLPMPALVAMAQPAKVLPVAGQPVRLAAVTPALVVLPAPVRMTGTLVKVMPAGKMSVSVMGAVVALTATAMTIL